MRTKTRIALATFSALCVALPVSLAACSKDTAPERIEPAPPAPPAASASASSSPAAPAAAAQPVDASFLAAVALDAGLTSREDAQLASILARLEAPCASEAVSIAQCMAEHRACPDCNRAARYLALGVHEGWPAQYVQAAFHSRFDRAELAELSVDGSPAQGPASASVVVIEFGSYVCPHCAAEAPKLDALQKAHPKDVRIVFKPMWSPQNAMQVAATRAALAAGAQGKFWEMHAALFANQPTFDADSIDKYAKSVGLDTTKLHADMASPAVTERMKKDIAAATAAHVDSLPSIWINGRAYLPFEDLEARLAFELAQK